MARMSDKPAREIVVEEPVHQPARDPLAGPDNELVRVRHAVTGDHFTTTRVLARRMGAEPLDQPATDRYGAPLPRKRNTTKSNKK